MMTPVIRAKPKLSRSAAKLACELPTWTDQRTFLELVLDVFPAGPTRVLIARALGCDDWDAVLAALAAVRETVGLAWQESIAWKPSPT